MAFTDQFLISVHWLGGPTTIERDISSSKRTVDIFCYTGTSKNLFALWQTVKVSY